MVGRLPPAWPSLPRRRAGAHPGISRGFIALRDRWVWRKAIESPPLALPTGTLPSLGNCRDVPTPARDLQGNSARGDLGEREEWSRATLKIRARAGDPQCNIPQSMNPHPHGGSASPARAVGLMGSPVPRESSNSHPTAWNLLCLGWDVGTAEVPFPRPLPKMSQGQEPGTAWDGHRSLGWIPWMFMDPSGSTSQMEFTPSGDTWMALPAPGTTVVPEPLALPKFRIIPNKQPGLGYF